MRFPPPTSTVLQPHRSDLFILLVPLTCYFYPFTVADPSAQNASSLIPTCNQVVIFMPWPDVTFLLKPCSPLSRSAPLASGLLRHLYRHLSPGKLKLLIAVAQPFPPEPSQGQAQNYAH